VIAWIRPLPAPFWVFLIAHTLIDGLIFVAGAWLAGRFRGKELAVLLLWGQATSLAVETSSVLADAWVYVTGHWWNPTLFHVAGHPITLAPQAAWLVLPLAFYAVVRRAEARPATRRSQASRPRSSLARTNLAGPREIERPRP
jgi:hypothetical protein